MLLIRCMDIAAFDPEKKIGVWDGKIPGLVLLESELGNALGSRQ